MNIRFFNAKILQTKEDKTFEIIEGEEVISLTPTGTIKALSKGVATVKITVVDEYGLTWETTREVVTCDKLVIVNLESVSNAIDANGNKVDLKYIDFIKVQVGVNTKSGWLGEVSTEVFGFFDYSMIQAE